MASLPALDALDLMARCTLIEVILLFRMPEKAEVWRRSS